MAAVLMRPVDTFFFRDNRPFSIGEDNVTTGLFPPRPGTVYGALRSAYIHRYSDFDTFKSGTNEMIKRWMGTPSEYGDFALRGIFLHDEDGAVFPLPLDYQVVKEGGREVAVPLVLEREDDHFASDASAYRLYGPRDGKSASSEGAYVDEHTWKEELFHRSGMVVRRKDHWVTEEAKVGIARSERTKQAIDGMFYQMSMLRFKRENLKNQGPGFLVVCERAPDFSGVPYALLGGEGRPWVISSIDRAPLFTAEEERQIAEQIRETKVARIILLTPAFWQYGTRPSGFDPSSGHLYIGEGIRVRLLTAAIGRPLLVGGWDIVANRPKPRRPAVPAGSVLYVEVKPEEAHAFVKAVHGRKWSDESAHEGYGYAVCGAYHHSAS